MFECCVYLLALRLICFNNIMSACCVADAQNRMYASTFVKLASLPRLSPDHMSPSCPTMPTSEFLCSIAFIHLGLFCTVFISNPFRLYRNTPESLGECFERNAEGMLKNMAIHELALLVSFYDVTVENIESVTADKEFSSMQTLPGPSGKEFTDFDKIKFTIKTKTGKVVSVAADRCGGTDSYATVTDANGEEVFRYWMPDDEDKATVQKLQAQYPTAMPYFFTQDPDYVTVKERVAKFTATGEEAEGVATIGIAVETLRVAEYLTPTLMDQLK